MDYDDDVQLMQIIDNELRIERDGDIGSRMETAFNIFIGIVLQTVFKTIAISIFVFRDIVGILFTYLVVNQLLLIFVVIDFWFTKNVVGKKMMSLRWYFWMNEYGAQRFMIQFRANKQKETAGSNVFWIIQILYTIAPLILTFIYIVQAPLVYIDAQRVALAFGIFLGAVLNLFYFMHASNGKNRHQQQLKDKLGLDVLRRLEYASVTTYI